MSINKNSGKLDFQLNGIVPGLDGSIVMAGGNTYFVDAQNGSDSNDGSSPVNAFQSMTKAFAALTANQNDILFVIGGAKALNLTATLVWNKNYTHLIGLCSANGISNRSRIFQTAATAFTPLVKVTASGCIFKNLEFFQGVTSTAALVCMDVNNSSRNRFENVHIAGMGFVGGGSAGQTGGRSLTLTGASENKFLDCIIGVDAASRTATNYELEFIAGTTACARNVFEHCKFISFTATGGAAHCMIKASASTLDRFQIFDTCDFINSGTVSGGIADTNLILSSSTADGGLMLRDAFVVGVTTLYEASSSGTVYVTGNIPTWATSGKAVAS
jgi:hypothetical protein